MNPIDEFGFLADYIGKQITALETTPYWSEKKHLTSSNTVVVTTDAGPIYFTCSCHQADFLYEENEDVLFSVSEGKSGVEYSSLDDIPLQTEKRDDRILDISLVYDEVKSRDCSINKTVTYPVGVFFHTDNSTIGIWRDSMDVSLLACVGEAAFIGKLWPLDELWGDYFSVPPFTVTRQAYSFYEEGVIYHEEKEYFPPYDGMTDAAL